MKINVSIEARMTSSRLPKKVLMPINGVKNLEIMIHRVKQSKTINNIIIATTTNKEDGAIINWCEEHNIDYFRGSEDNVYERVLQTHEYFESDIIVELTGDCPLLDPILIDEVVNFYKEHDYDYVANCLKESYPLGMAIQVYSLDTLKSVYLNRNLEYQDKEHVTPYLYSSGKYNIYNIEAPKKYCMPSLSVTLDTQEDFEVIQNVVQAFDTLDFGLEDIIKFAQQNPKLISLNQNIHRKGLN